MSVEPGGVESRLRRQTSCRDSLCHRLLILHSLLGNRATGLCSHPRGPREGGAGGRGAPVSEAWAFCRLHVPSPEHGACGTGPRAVRSRGPRGGSPCCQFPWFP